MSMDKLSVEPLVETDTRATRRDEESLDAPAVAEAPLEAPLARFWDIGPEFDRVVIKIEPPETPLALLKQLGPSPFEAREFPLLGFLATTYDKVSRYALERAN
jgi:uncharacterized Zn finger protein